MAKTKEERQKDAVAYQMANYHRIPLSVFNEDMDIYRTAAGLSGLSLNAWIKDLMAKRCDEMGLELPSKKTRKNQ